jgi:phage tail-like protein
MKASNASPEAGTERSAPPQRSSPPLTGLHFAVGIHGLQSTGAVEVVLPSARIVAGGRSARRVEFTPLTVRRGLSDNTEWYDWWNDARRLTRPPRRLVTISVRHPSGTEGVRWFFRDSVPVAYALSPLNALTETTLIESLELRVGNFELFRRQ